MAVLKRHPLPGPNLTVNDLAHEVARRACEAITKLATKDQTVKDIVRLVFGVQFSFVLSAYV